MDHMHITGTKPLSVILRQTNKFSKLKRGAPRVQKQAEVERDGVINTQKNTIPINSNAKNFDALKTLQINRS